MAVVKPKRTGFIGLGNIGKPMALRLAADESIDLQVFDVAPEPVAELVAAGATAAESIGAMGNWADVICVMVRDDDQVRSVLGEVLTDLKTRNDFIPVSFVIHSTVAPETPAELTNQVMGVCGFAVEIVDAPVSGGPMGAADGSLAIMVGASPEALQGRRAGALRHGLEDRPRRRAGRGHQVQAGTQPPALRLVHGDRRGGSPRGGRRARHLVALGDVVRHTDAITGGPGAIMHRNTTAPIPEGDFWEGIFTHVQALGEKDLGFAIKLADKLGVDVPLSRMAIDQLGPALGLQGDHDG